MIEDTKVVYPTLDIYSCPRFLKQRVYNAHLPLLKYRQPITANNCYRNYEGDFVDSSLCRKFEPKDGMIYSLKKIKKTHPQIKGIKVLICVSMYNQSKHAINLTLNGIYKNLHHFRKKGISDGEIAVLFVQDGILKMVADRKKRTYCKGEDSMIQFYRTLDKYEQKTKCDLEERVHIILDEIQNYERKGMGSSVQQNHDFPPSIEKNLGFLYQNYWKPSITYYGQENVPDGPERLLLLTCFKHINGTKLSTHLWFFEGFCRYLKPEFCVAMDVGTAPDELGIVNLIKGFSIDPNIGGVTGFMSVDTNFKSQEQEKGQQKTQNCFMKYILSIEKAQEYQYIFSHLFDKNAESALGFLHVLPGAWAAYRYEALIKSQKFQPNILQKNYFKMILNPDMEAKDFREANMYLAQDRILSLGIYCQMDSKYTLKYIPDAIAYTDPMKDHENLMNQRRRWINSSIYAFLYVFKNYYYSVMNSNHNCFRRYITLNISMILAYVSLVLTYISPSFYLFILYALVNQMGFQGSSWVAKAVSLVYVLTFLSAIAGSLKGKKWVKHAYIISIILGIFNILLVFLGIFNIVVIYFAAVNNPLIESNQQLFDINTYTTNFRMMSIIVMGGIIFGSFFLILFIHIPTHLKFVFKIIVNTPSYIAYSGAYSQTMVIYSFCNIDDVSWGTKGSSSSGVNRFQMNKVYFLSTWFLTNAILAFIFLYIDVISQQNGANKGGGYVLIAISIAGSSIVLLKGIFAIYHQLKWLIAQRCCYKIIGQSEKDRLQKIDRYWITQNESWKKNYQNKSFNSFIMKKKAPS